MLVCDNPWIYVLHLCIRNLKCATQYVCGQVLGRKMQRYEFRQSITTRCWEVGLSVLSYEIKVELVPICDSTTSHRKSWHPHLYIFECILKNTFLYFNSMLTLNNNEIFSKHVHTNMENLLQKFFCSGIICTTLLVICSKENQAIRNSCRLINFEINVWITTCQYFSTRKHVLPLNHLFFSRFGEMFLDLWLDFASILFGQYKRTKK